MNYYFSPQKRVCDRSQIMGSIGMDPLATDEKVLNYLGIYRIAEWSGERNIFFSPESEYEIVDGLAHQRPSQSPLPLSEAKEKAEQLLISQFRSKVQSLCECSGLPVEILSLSNDFGIPSLVELRERLSNEALGLSKSLKSVEEAKDVDQLQKICYEP